MQRYVIDAQSSWIRVLVYRAGLMSAFGHNHVVASNAINGTVVYGNEPRDATVELFFPVQSLVVDDRSLRDLEGDDFSRRVSDKDISGTRKNMLGENVLDADNYETIRIKSTDIQGEIDSLLVTANVSVAGRVNLISFPASVVFSDGTVTISGIADIRQEELGLKPFSAAFGTLKTHQDLTIRFEIRAVLQ
jgi:polyisoprenoid-binding protein YceI